MDIREYVYSKRDFTEKALSELVAIPSVKGEAKNGAPFGAECRKALEKACELYRENGFSVREDYDGGFVVAEYGDGDGAVGLYAHADVVPAGDGWTLTSPFKMAEKDGFFIGRGVCDDKCGIVMSLISAMAIRDLKLPFCKKLVMFTGSNEEMDMTDILNFRENNTVPEQNIVIDAEFPVFRGEKSMVHFYAKSPRITDENLTDISGGEAVNIVLGKAEAVYKNEKITADGISKHAAYPEGSLNAGVPLFEKLINLTNPETAKILKYAKELICTFDGSAFGIKTNDPDFGPLTCTNGIIRLEDGALLMSFDVRFGVSVSADDVVASVKQKLCSIGFEAQDISKKTGFIIPNENKLVKEILKLWKEYTGKDEAAILSGGGTYSRMLTNSVSIGTSIPNGEKLNLPSGHGEEHQPDESININGFLEATVFLTELLLKL